MSEKNFLNTAPILFYYSGPNEVTDRYFNKQNNRRKVKKSRAIKLDKFRFMVYNRKCKKFAGVV